LKFTSQSHSETDQCRWREPPTGRPARAHVTPESIPL
jgi:hypothetical protein